MGLRGALRRWRGSDEADGRPHGAADDGSEGFTLPPAQDIGDVRSGHTGPLAAVPAFRAADAAAPDPGTLVLGSPVVADPAPREPATPAATQLAPTQPSPTPVAADPVPAPAPEVATPPARRSPAHLRRPFDDAHPLDAPGEVDRGDLEQAWALVRDRPDKLVLMFYAELFARLPEAPRMFPSAMTRQRTEFGKALVQWVATPDPEVLRPHLEQLGADHRKFDVLAEHYDVAGKALLGAWCTLAGDDWTERHEAAVLGSYARLAHMMLAGAKLHEHEPATWHARVVDHQPVSRDFAVLTLQPDEPYPYRAGQYLTLEIPSHRRQWRQMSIASAPRPDNCFDLQVRVQGGAGVSAALVRYTAVGDRVLIGPPRGTALVVEPGTAAHGLLCIASGTGSAPMTAVVDSVLRWPEPPARIDVFVGGRTPADVHGVRLVDEVIRAHAGMLRAQAHAVLAGDAGQSGYRGRVEEVVPGLRNWAALGVDVLVAGPDAMIQATIANLTRTGVPRERIHFDRYEAG